jgi:hypothetical protein
MRQYPNSVQTPEQRKAKYAILRSLGYSPAHARQMRDFHNSTIRRFEDYRAHYPQHASAIGGAMA